MGFLSRLLGLEGGAKSESKKQEIRNKFNSLLENGESYVTLSVINIVYEKKLFKDVTTYYNYILGYKDGDDPEIVIISTDNTLSSFEPPIICKRSECNSAFLSDKSKRFTIDHPAFGEQPLEFFIDPTGSTNGGYTIGVSQSQEFQPFYDFFMDKFAK